MLFCFIVPPLLETASATESLNESGRLIREKYIFLFFNSVFQFSRKRWSLLLDFICIFFRHFVKLLCHKILLFARRNEI